MPDLATRVRAWSYRRQRLDRTAADIPTVLADVVAVYATQPTAILSLAARVADLRPADYRRLDTDRSAVRIPAMRSSGHLVPTATLARIAAATRRPAASFDWIWRGVGLTEPEYRAAGAAIVAAAATPVTVAELRTRLPMAAASLLDRHPQAATMLVRSLRAEGALVALAPSSLRSNAFAYVAVEAWLGGPLEPVDPDDALAWLAGEYLRAFGPARVADFRWWAGTTAERAQAAVGRHATVDLGAGLLLPIEDRDAFATTAPLDADTLALLPLWDMYTMGYAPDGRDRFVRPEDRARAYDGSGNGYGLVLSGGLAVAAWGLRFVGRRMEIDLDPFIPLDLDRRATIVGRFEALGALLDAADVVVADGRPRGPGGPGSRRPG